MSTYQPNIPTGLVNLDVDYQNLQNNFSQLDTSFGVNHIKFSVTPNNGKHTFVEMPVSASIPTPLTGSEGTLYTKTVTATELFYTPDNSTNEYQMTRTISASFGTFSTFTNYAPPLPTQNGGWTFLPGGMLFQYGTKTIAANATITTIVFPVAFTNTNTVITLTREKTDTSTTAQEIRIVTGSITASQFQVIQSSGSSTNIVHWHAIGK